MTTLPDLEPAALEAATKAVTAEINRYWQDDTVEPGHEPVAAAAVRAYLSAAHSVPEAGKAVDWREAMQLAIDYLKETKHGSPARSAGHNARLVLEAALAATQAVPAEDVADPYELANQLFGYSDESTPDYLAEFLEDNGRMATALADRLTASEAEATSLRRKLEERERIGKMMANAAYNIHQRAADIHVGFGLDDAIRSLKSVQEEWDRALSGASE